MEIINLKNSVELEFEAIIKKRNECQESLKDINELLEKINTKYNTLQNDIINNLNKEVEIYLGIDSLNFQYKILLNKYNNQNSLFNKITTRMYGDYYKVYKLIKKYISTNTNISIIDVNFTIFKDLNDNNIYHFDEICKIQNTINQYIQSLYDLISKKNTKIQPFIKSSNIGFDVNYYINEENTNIEIYSNKCTLFINYLKNFNNYHTSYLNDFLLQSNFILANLKAKIDFNNINNLLDINSFIEKNNYSIKEVIDDNKEEKSDLAIYDANKIDLVNNKNININFDVSNEIINEKKLNKNIIIFKDDNFSYFNSNNDIQTDNKEYNQEDNQKDNQQDNQEDIQEDIQEDNQEDNQEHIQKDIQIEELRLKYKEISKNNLNNSESTFRLLKYCIIL